MFNCISLDPKAYDLMTNLTIIHICTANRDILVNKSNHGYFYTCNVYKNSFNIISKPFYLTLNCVSFIPTFDLYNKIKNI